MSSLRLRAAGAAVLALLALAVCSARVAAQEEEGRAPPPPRELLHLYATGALSIRQTPLNTSFLDVLSGDVRAGVPVAYGLEPWVEGAAARVKVACDPSTGECSKLEKRVVVGVLYQRFGGGGGRSERAPAGPYVGAGLGSQFLRGKSQLAHNIMLGFPLGSSRGLSPLVELRVENHDGFGDVLMIAGGIHFGAGRR